MRENASTTDRPSLKALYGPTVVPTFLGCRTCGLMGWDNALQGR